MNTSDQTFFNPQSTYQPSFLKSFLQKKGSTREQGNGSQFFMNNSIRSCSYVKEDKGGYKAVPFYEKRNTKIYPTHSLFKRSWTSQTFGNKTSQNAGMGTPKRLVPYDPKAQRSMMNIPDFKPRYPNSSQIEIGGRSMKDEKHYITTNKNKILYEGKTLKSMHPGIQAFRNKWLRSRIEK